MAVRAGRALRQWAVTAAQVAAGTYTAQSGDSTPIFIENPDAVKGYTSLVGHIRQQGTNAPVLTVLANDTGRTFTLSRQTGTGTWFRLTPNAAFADPTKVALFISPSADAGATNLRSPAPVYNAAYVDIHFKNSANASADLGNDSNGSDATQKAVFELRIYP